MKTRTDPGGVKTRIMAGVSRSLNCPSATGALCSARRAFTLVELLTVMAVISIMAVTAAPAVIRITCGGPFDQALIQVSGSLEQARAYAVANNTYTYAAFATGPDRQLYLMIFGSADGSPGITAGLAQHAPYSVAAPGAADDAKPLTLINKIEKLGGVRLRDSIPDGNALPRGNPMLKNPAVGWSSGGATFTCNARPIYGNLVFDRAIQFTPEGAARVDRFTPSAINAVLVPVKGDSSSGREDLFAASSVWVTGLTGHVRVFCP